VQYHRHAAALIATGSTVILDGGTTVLAAVRTLQSDLRATVVTHSPTVASSEKIGAASRFAVLSLAGVAGVVTDAGGENAAERSLGAPLIHA
jgi:DeoR/GlpR family transcriptional regulator of sugar metabolism